MRILPKHDESFSERGQLVRELDLNRIHADKAVRAPHSSALRTLRSVAAFTMVEIAICLAVIGFALVAIIGVLPIGMSVQKENREDTIINFDANYLMDAIRSGARGLDNLTNYVVVITNITTLCNSNGVPSGKSFYSTYGYAGYTNGQIVGGVVQPGPTFGNGALTNGTNIMLLLNWPKYVSTFDANRDYWSNYISADFRSITGSPLDQGTNQASKDFAFKYRVTVEIVPSASYPYNPSDTIGLNNFTAPGQLTNAPEITNQTLNGWQYAKNLQANMYDIRLRFRWPVLPGGKLGNGDRVFRSSMSGNNGPFIATNLTWLPPGPPYTGNYNPAIYFLMQPQSYSAAQ